MAAPRRLAILLAATAALAGCAGREALLPGPREDVRPELGLAEAAPAAATPAPLALPPARALAAWPMRVGTADNDPGHAALGPAPAPLWTVRIGQGETRRQRITADPVSDGARLYAMDADSAVAAVTPAGALAWTRALTPPADRAGEAAGGGLAVVDGTLYAATAFGELHALDPATGATRWVQRLDAPLTSPKAADGIVYVVSRDGRAWALDADTGRVLWEQPGAPGGVVSAAAPGPALAGQLVVFPFGSGEIVAALRRSGVRVWGSGAGGERLGVAYNLVGDVTGDPLIADGRVYAGTLAGRIVALDLATGRREWTSFDGAVSPLARAGSALFAVSDRNQLLRLDAGTGEVAWRRDLPFFLAERVNRREAIHAQHGPVLAGGRLWVASSGGVLRGFDPVTGALAASLPVPGGAASRPVAVGGALYVVGRDGTMHAFR